MADSSTFYLMLMILLTCNASVKACYTSVISFGDSLADTGNLKLLYQKSTSQAPHFMYPPYGETYFHEATGRFSNGRLIIDFIAERLGLMLIPPSQGVDFSGNETGAGLGQGVNFAVAGATALDSAFHEARGVVIKTNASLGVQMGWFKDSLPLICSAVSDCKQLIECSLILMGEIGGNDYNHALESGKSIAEVQTYVPFVINSIIAAVNELIDLGARTIVIPGNLPIGCSATYLTKFYGSKKMQYDNSTGCITQLNNFAEYHNELLKTKLNQIREVKPEVNIIYADYYNAAMKIFLSPNTYGFTNGALKACCGGGGPFNYNVSVSCADPLSTTCAQPDTYFNWDGLHLTEAAYKIIFESVFEGSYTTPQFKSLCPNSRLQSVGDLLGSI